MTILDALLIGAGLAVFGVLFVAGCAILGLSAMAQARAIAEINRARAHGVEADTNIATLRAGTDAVENADEFLRPRARAPRVPPTTAEIAYAQILEREPETTTVPPSPNGKLREDFDTDTNAGMDEARNIGGSGEYRT